jgi:hypothetical protein
MSRRRIEATKLLEELRDYWRWVQPKSNECVEWPVPIGQEGDQFAIR